jgi:hypothetical protein
MVTTSGTGRCGRLWHGLTPILGTLICSLVLIYFDVVAYGNDLFSFFTCPIMFLVAVVRTVFRRPSFVVAAARLLIPVATLLLAIENHSVQKRIAMGNAARLIQACEQYHEANRNYPERLGDLVRIT